jgi:hypothetical protein
MEVENKKERRSVSLSQDGLREAPETYSEVLTR